MPNPLIIDFHQHIDNDLLLRLGDPLPSCYRCGITTASTSSSRLCSYCEAPERSAVGQFGQRPFNHDVCPRMVLPGHPNYSDEQCNCPVHVNNRRRRTHTAATQIQSYNANVARMLASDKGRLLYGVELEMATSRSEDVTNTLSFAYPDALAKHDGSIVPECCDCDDDECSCNEYSDWTGFELVTRPMTYNNQVNFWRRFDNYRSRRLRSWELGTCGMHVHVSKSGLSHLTLGKLLVFINNDQNAELVIKVAKRDSRRWARRLNKELKDGQPLVIAEKINKGLLDRYEAINLTNARTIEFRIFAGSLRLSTILSNLEFVRASIEFCRDTSLRRLSANDFVSWLRSKQGFTYLKDTLGIKTKKLQKPAGGEV